MKVKLVRSLIQRKSDQVATARALGLRRIGDVAEVPDDPSMLGMVKKINFLLEVIDTGATVPGEASSAEGVRQ